MYLFNIWEACEGECLLAGYPSLLWILPQLPPKKSMEHNVESSRLKG